MTEQPSTHAEHHADGATDRLRVTCGERDGKHVVEVAWDGGAVVVTPAQAHGIAARLRLAATLAPQAPTEPGAPRSDGAHGETDPTVRPLDDAVRSLLAARRDPAEIALTLGISRPRVYAITRRLGFPARKTCDVDGCDTRTRWSSAWCAKHGHRAALHGHPLGRRAPAHGRRGYERGCRCDVCKAAPVAAAARVRERGRVDPSLIPHGTASGYRNWACRCATCKAAGAESNRAAKARRREARLRATGGETV